MWLSSRITDEINVRIIRHGVDFDRTVAVFSLFRLCLNVSLKVSRNRVSKLLLGC